MQTETRRQSPNQVNTFRPVTLEQIAGALGDKASNLRVNHLRGDASTRRYFRVSTSDFSESWILMQLESREDKTALTQKRYRWENMLHILEQQGLQVPRLIEVFRSNGALLLQDLGDEHVSNHIECAIKLGRFEQIQQTYTECTQIIADLALIDPFSCKNWDGLAFNEKKWLEELIFFHRHGVSNYFKIHLSDTQKQLFAAEIKKLAKQLTLGPQILTHRDFHSRNLLISQNSIWQIDFQDARLGPAAYDLVSLIFDPYVNLSINQRQDLLRKAISQLSKTLQGSLVRHIQDSWPDVLLQRTLKVIGSYTYLIENHHDGQRYLQSLERAIQILNTCQKQRWPFLADFLTNHLTDAQAKHNTHHKRAIQQPVKSSLIDSTAGFILAAGKGTRLQPLTKSVPKPLVPVLGIPALYLQIFRLAKLGLDTIFINTHHLADQVHQTISDYPLPGRPKIHILHEPNILGTGGGLEQARSILKESGKSRIFTINADIFSTLSFEQLLKNHVERDNFITMALKVREDKSFTAVWFDGQRVKHIGDKPTSPHKTNDLLACTFTGIHILENRALEGIPHHQHSSITDHYRKLIREGAQIGGILHKGIAWHDIGSWAGYREAHKSFTFSAPYNSLLQQQYGVTQLITYKP